MNLIIDLDVGTDIIKIKANGSYTLEAAKNLFRNAIDSALHHHKSRVLIDVMNISGRSSFMDRYSISEHLATYLMNAPDGKSIKIALVGNEPIVDNSKIVETVAVNRGANLKVFSDPADALSWL